MPGHGITKCVCGYVVQQCRCMGPHTVTTVHGCKRCESLGARAAKAVGEAAVLLRAGAQ